MPELKIGGKVPDFSLVTTGGTFRLRDHRGTGVVLYFYPRDNTSGCTREAEAFRDHHDQFRRAGALVLGVSPDSVDSHQRFREKLALPFDLGCDPEHELAARFGAWKQKTLYGRRFMGIERSTFLIDDRGLLQAEWRKVRVAGHAEAVLAALAAR
ncbi:MAG: peroxiredoxin [Gammaproteobacteria bacterium]|nr:MAG: peroxiredoxin [Gammaproteobacteria bacterium]